MGFPDGVCRTPVGLCAIRATQLDNNGVPLPGAGNTYVKDDVIQLEVATVLTPGDDFEQKNGCGTLVVARKTLDQIKRVDLTLQVISPDPELIEILAGGSLITQGANTIGYAIPAIGTSANPNGAFLEGWSPAYVGDSQDGNYDYIRWVFPKTRFTLGRRTINNGIITTELTGYGEENPNAFDGPANDLPNTTLSQRAYQWYYDTNIPDATCGATTLAAS